MGTQILHKCQQAFRTQSEPRGASMHHSSFRQLLGSFPRRYCSGASGATPDRHQDSEPHPIRLAAEGHVDSTGADADPAQLGVLRSKPQNSTSTAHSDVEMADTSARQFSNQAEAAT